MESIAMSYSDGADPNLIKRIGCSTIALLLIGANLFALLLISSPADCWPELPQCANFELKRALIFPGIPLLSLVIAALTARWMSKSKD